MSSLSTSTSVVIQERSASGLTSIAADYLTLTKPKIAVLVLVTVAITCYVASWGHLEAALLLHTLVGTGLVAASASAANQWLERKRDALMERTAERPLPAHRLRSGSVLAFSSVLLLAGTIYLGWAANGRAAMWGLLTWLAYVLLYTPLKSRTPWNTAVGAVAGALPVFIGWTAMGAPLGWRSTALFMLVFLWQFPHFMAIAWIYRAQYARAGMRMMTVVDPSGRAAGLQAVLASLAMLPVSITPALIRQDLNGVLFASAALALGCGMLGCSMLFLATRSDRSARILLRASLVYLPAFFGLLLLLTPFV
jgi:heme o synthase